MYREARIFNADEYYASANILPGKETDDTIEIPLYAESDVRGIYPVGISEYSVSYDLRLNDDLMAPIKKGDKLGILRLTYQDVPLAEVPLYASQSVEASMPESEQSVEVWAEEVKTVYEPRPTEYTDGFRFDFAATLLGEFVQMLGELAIEPIYFTLALIFLFAAGLAFVLATLIGLRRRNKEKELLRSVNKMRRKRAFDH
jgi:hypothetical protein